MSIKRLSGAGLTTPKSNKLWDQVTFQSGMFAIATIAITSNQSSVVFDNIPSTYNHLQLRGICRTTLAAQGNASLALRFNSDSGSNYGYHRVYASQAYSTAQGGSGLSETSIGVAGIAAGDQNLANQFGASVIDILDYASTSKNKVIRSLAGGEDTTVGYIGLHSGLWINSSNPITTIAVVAGAGQQFKAYSHFALYGIKAA